MKRSEINTIMRDAVEFMRQRSFYLPPFAYWGPAEWQKKGEEASEIAQNEMGWDITDFGLGNYKKDGLCIFVVRNGGSENVKTMKGKLYCEKVLISGVNQRTPTHFHWRKVEDIINRGGGKLVIRVYNSTPDEGLADTDVTVKIDGVRRTVKPGEDIVLDHGESISLPSRLYHEFWGTEEPVLVGEVSLVAEDQIDNRFYERVGRFPEIEEDEPPLFLLTQDYRKHYRYSRK